MIEFSTYGAIVAGCWVFFWFFWLISAFFAKRSVRRAPWWKGAGLRLLILIAAIAVFHDSKTRLAFWRALYSVTPRAEPLGAAMCVCGILFAVWARVNIGRNWGQPMSLKEQPELVATGPYAYVRHPIYSGILLALLGTALVGSGVCFLLFIFFFIYLIYSAKTEERLLLQQFPDSYPEYMKRTKMLIPFVL